MLISKRIRDQIEALDVNRNTKDLMMEILKIECNSPNRYKGAYDKKIEQYLDKDKCKGGKH
jgi:hypothetical protein